MQNINLSLNRRYAVEQWRSGGVGVKEAAEKALLGTDEDIANFLKGEDAIERIDDRVDVSRVVNAGGPAVREAGINALKSQDPEDARAFLNEGWKAPLQLDQRVEVGKLINAGGNGVRDAGKKALQGTPEDVAEFLKAGQFKAREIDNRVEAGKLINAGGQNVRAAGKTALQGTPEDVVEFLQVGQFVARDRDQEYATVEQLAEQAEQAGLQAKRDTEAAIEAKNRAVAASNLAKEAAERAAREAREVRDNAATAALKARQAADAAKAASEATQRAISAANAANRSSRVAALASARAANAAIGAANAASQALSAAAAAADDASMAEEARGAAARARTAAAGAKKASQAAKKASEASLAAGEAANASLSASSNADAAAYAADEADSYASAAGHYSGQARAAAAETRRHAQESRRAANAASALASKSAHLASEAQAAADKAATHAENAAKAAEDAAQHAGEAKTAATKSAQHADAAKAAADEATAAVATAKKVFALARETEAEDLNTRTAAAMERAKSQKAASDEFTAQAAESVVEGKAIEDDTADLAAQAAKSGADTKALAPQGRAIALRVLKHFGSWRQDAAARALSGTDDDVLEYLRTGWKKAEQDETRQQVADLATRSPYEAVRTGAAQVLKGDTPEQIRDFYTTGQFQVANIEYRVLIGKIHNEGGPSVKEAAKKALADGSPQSMLAFLNSGQYQARHIDERVIAGKLINDGGPEIQAAAKIALTGSADRLHDFIQVGQYMAERKDQLAATHLNQVERLIHEADVIQAKAQQNRWLAAKAAAQAKKASDTAQQAADQAAKSSAEANRYAAEARNSADKAENSSVEAAKAATTARNAADRAGRDTVAAEESAAQAEFSASYARRSALEARDAADDARYSALDAGKSADEAKNLASQAWAEVVKKREAELAEARRQAEEARKKEREKEREKEQKKPCIPYSARDNLPPCMYAVAGGSDEYYYESPAIDPTMKEIVWEVFGLNDAKECVKDPGFGSCAMAVMSVLPIGKLKLVKKLEEGVEDIVKGTRVAKKCFQCFLAGTKVLMADHSTKNIESVRVGDKVIATDPVSGETGRRAVTRTIVTEHDKHFNELTIATPQGKRRLTATNEHPFWSPSQSAWVEAAHLRLGMTLGTDDGSAVKIEGNRPFAKNARTYNLTVDDLHTYYVLAGETPVLVHNSNCLLTGGFKVGVTPDEIADINRGFGGETLLSGSPANTMANASRYNSFWDKSAVVIRDIAGGHMFNNGNKRTAQAVVEQLMQRNNVTSGLSSADLRSVIDRVGKGQLHGISDISAALRGY
ncbi:polymorphic toxin-type HINT domain-containing protein [Streptomyces celluloflavus]|uniref:polymorphic toxin-type HINT domain-containing protein n=1 Tax=Streptomyces celluloflavus TaxID=58344 RepID=UPI0036C02F9D